jgi:hypothetical protein
MSSPPDDIASILAGPPAPSSSAPDIGAILGAPSTRAPAPTPYANADIAYPSPSPSPWKEGADAQVYSDVHPTAQSVSDDINRRIADHRAYLNVGGFTGALRAEGDLLKNYGQEVKSAEGQVFSHKNLEGESFLSSPIKSVTEVVGQVPQFVASVAGAIAGAADTYIYDPETGARIESDFDKALPTLTRGYIAGNEPTTELAREVNGAVGFLFSPVTALGPAIVNTQHDITGSTSPYLHYVGEGISDVTGIAAGSLLGRIGRTSKSAPPAPEPEAAPEAATTAPAPEPEPASPRPSPPASAQAPDELQAARDDMATVLANHRTAADTYRQALKASATRGSGAVQEAQATRQAAAQRAQPDAVRRELEDEYRDMDVRTMGPRAADEPTAVRQRRKLVARDLPERQTQRNQEVSDATALHDKLARQHATKMRKAGERFEAEAAAAPGDHLAGLPPHIRVPLERALTEAQQRYLRALHGQHGAPEDMRQNIEVQELSEEDLSPADRELVRGVRERSAAAEAQRGAASVVNTERMTQSRSEGEAAADQQGLRQAVTAVLGPELAKRVRYVKDEAGLPNGGVAVGERVPSGARVSGLHTAEGHTYVVTDSVRTPERAVWTAVHEVAGHGGMSGLVDRFSHLVSDGENVRSLYTKARTALLTNPMVRMLAERIGAERHSTDLPRMAEEAAAELQAARLTGRWDMIKQRYGLDASETLKQGAEAVLSPWRRVLNRITNAIAEHVLGRKPSTPFERAVGGNAVFSDADVHAMLKQMHEHAGREATAPEAAQSRVPKTPPSPFTPEEQAQLDAAMRSMGFSDRLNERLAGEQANAKEAHAFDEAKQADARVEQAAASVFGPEDVDEVAHVAEDGRGPAYTAAAQPFPVDEHGAIDFGDMDTLNEEIPNTGRRGARAAFEGWFPVDQPGLTEAGVRTLQNLSDGEGTVQRGLAAMKELWRGMQTMFPDITKPEIAKAAAAMLERVSSARAEAARFSRNMRSFSRLIAKLTPEQQAAVYRLAEQGTTRDAHRGTDVPLPENVDWKGWFAYIRRVHDRQFEAINRARGFAAVNYRQNHFARFVKSPEGTVFNSASGAVTEAFEHARQFPTMDSILNQPTDAPRWQPYSMNLAMNEMRWAQSVQRYVARWETTRTLARMGAIRTVGEDYVPTPDEAKFKAPDQHSWLAGPRTLVAAMHNGPFAEPLMGRAARMATAGMVLRPAWNAVTQSVLALSLYHPFSITFYSAPVHALTESLANVRDPWSVQGVVDIAKSLAKALPGAPGRSFVAGEHVPAHEALSLLSGKRGGLDVDKATGRVTQPAEDPVEVAMDVMRGLRPASDAAAPTVELMRRVAVGGMQLWGKGEFHNEAMERFSDAVTQHRPLAASGWALPALLRSLGSPIMDGFIPWMKMRAYMADTEGWTRANPGQVGSDAERLSFQRYGREIDQRFGEMATSNLFWNRWITGVLHGSMLSFGWNYGLVSQMMGGGKDVAQLATRALQGRELPAMRTRLGYAGLYTAYGLGLGFLMTRFVGGQPITSIKDGVYPVMRKEPDGTAYRVKMPGWLQDFGATYYHVRTEGVTAGLADEAANKAAPTLSLLHQLWTNQNYYNQQIRDPMDPWYMQMAEAGHAALQSTVPFTVTNFLRQQSDPQGPGTLVDLTTNALGINEAASYTREPIAVQKIFYLQHSQGLSGVTPYANAVRDDGMRSYGLRQLYQQGRATGDYTSFMKAMREVSAKYGLTPRQTRYEMERFAAPSGAFTLRELPRSDQEDIWDAMTDDPALLRQYYPYFNKQLRAQRLEQDPALLQALRSQGSP